MDLLHLHVCLQRESGEKEFQLVVSFQNCGHILEKPIAVKTIVGKHTLESYISKSTSNVTSDHSSIKLVSTILV